MTKSRTVGPVRVRPHVRDGVETGKWFVDVPASLTGDGKRKRKLFDNRKRATEVARELGRRLDPVTGKPRPRSQMSGLTFGETAALWEEDEKLRVQTLKKRQSTLDADLYRLRSLCRFLGDKDVAAITSRDLAQYQKWRLDQGRKPRTINTELGTLSLVMNWALKQEIVTEVPKTERIPVRRVEAIIPTPEEAVRIIEAMPPRLQPLVRFLFETGCRRGEALNLTWDCVDEVGGWVEIRARDGWTPKTQQSERLIPLNPSLLEMIRGLPKEGSLVFPGDSPEEPVKSFRRSFKAAVKKADIRRRGQPAHLTPQSCRRAHATWQAMNGVNESVLQGLLGHAAGSRVTKAYYVHATEDAKRAAVIELPLTVRNRNAKA